MLGPNDSSDAFEFHEATKADDDSVICTKMPLALPFISYKLDSRFRSSDAVSSSSKKIIPFRYALAHF